MPVDIIFQHHSLIVVNKPAGVPVHGSRQFEDRPQTLISMLREQLGQVVHPVHRLDRAVSGINLFTSDKSLLAPLSQAFEQREVHKSYLAVVRGWPAAQGIIDHAILPPRDDRKPSSIRRDAVTRYRRLAQAEMPWPVAPYPASRCSLVQLQPLTGRRHQLRRHMKHLGHPIIGDTTYGRGEYNRLFREKYRCRRLLLHAHELQIRLPNSGELIRWRAELTDGFGALIDHLQWHQALEKA